MLRLLFFLLFIIQTQAIGLKSNAEYVINMNSNGFEKRTDVFGRTKSGNPFQLGAYPFATSSLRSDFGSSATSSGIVTHDSVEGLMRLKSGIGTGTAKFRSHQYHVYQPDKAQEIELSLTPGHVYSGGTKIWGYKDDLDGVYFKLESDNKLQVCILTSTTGTPVESCVGQDDFNIKDPISEYFMNNIWTPDFATIYSISFQWLGSGVVNFFVTNPDGIPMLIYTFNNPLKNNKSYMKRPSLPVSFEVSTDSTNKTTNEMKVSCGAVVSNGGEFPNVLTYAAGLPSIKSTTNANENYVVSFRIKDLYNGNPNNTTIFPASLKVAAQGGTIIYRVYQNCELSGASWSNITVGQSPGGFLDLSKDDSGAEYESSGTISNCEKLVGTGTLFGNTSGQTVTASSLEAGFRAFKLTRLAFNGSETFSITVQRWGADDADYNLSLRWGEVR